MGSSMSLEEKFKALMKSYQTISSSNLELENHNVYLRHQLEETKKQTRSVEKSSFRSIHEDDRESSSYSSSSLREKESHKKTPSRNWHPTSNFDEFRVKILEFEQKLTDEFLEWLHTAEWIFEYKEVLEDKKVKLVALHLRKYASLWWTNVCAKRVRDRKEKFVHGEDEN